ncbi:14944_t:CDS:1, partial [Gigaspora margarita]
TQPPNNRGQLQRSQNIRGLQNVNNQLQRILNLGMPPPRLQNTTNLFTGTFIAIQYDLINGTNPFMKMQGVTNPLPQSLPFSTLLFSGVSFP